MTEEIQTRECSFHPNKFNNVINNCSKSVFNSPSKAGQSNNKNKSIIQISPIRNLSNNKDFNEKSANNNNKFIK